MLAGFEIAELVYQYISLFHLKIELLAKLKTRIFLKGGSLMKKNLQFHIKVCPIVDLKTRWQGLEIS